MFAMLAVFVIGIISSSYAQTENPQKIICENEIIENGVFKSITIQPNSECVIRNVQVLKNLIMLNSADIELSGSTIGGNIIVKESTDDVNIEINDSIIEKNIRIVQSADRDVTLRISNSEIKKNIILKNQHIDDFEITNTKIGNNIRIVNNEIGDDVRIDSSDISGNIVINKNTSESEIEIKSTSIGKNLKANLNNLQTDFTIDSNLILGNIILKNNLVNETYLIENNVEGKILVINNIQLPSGKFHIFDNESDMNIKISNNQLTDFAMIDNISDSAIKITNNIVDDEYVCARNLPQAVVKNNIVAGEPRNFCSVPIFP